MLDTKILDGLRNGQNTDLAKGTVRNADAVLMLLNDAGGIARVGLLKEGLKKWRRGRRWGYLFQYQPANGNSGYGFIGRSFSQESTVVKHIDYDWSGNPGCSLAIRHHESVRRNYYYRLRRGVVAISAEGYKRLGELGIARKTNGLSGM